MHIQDRDELAVSFGDIGVLRSSLEGDDVIRSSLDRTRRTEVGSRGEGEEEGGVCVRIFFTNIASREARHNLFLLCFAIRRAGIPWIPRLVGAALRSWKRRERRREAPLRASRIPAVTALCWSLPPYHPAGTCR